MIGSQIQRHSNLNTKISMDERTKAGLTSLLLIAAIIALVILVNFLVNNPLSPKEFWQVHELEQNQATWESQHITHYRMSIDFQGYVTDFDRMPVRVEVDNDQIISVVDSLGNKMFPTDYSRLAYICPDTLTIPALFSFAKQTIYDQLPTINISYDPALGYPEKLDVIPYPEPCCQGFAIEVQDFEVLQ